jgi:hypothetical protein
VAPEDLRDAEQHVEHVLVLAVGAAVAHVAVVVDGVGHLREGDRHVADGFHLVLAERDGEAQRGVALVEVAGHAGVQAQVLVVVLGGDVEAGVEGVPACEGL